MATYAIGDIQGCFEPLTRLLAKIAFNTHRDTLYLAGDLVNRGPDSFKVLKWAWQNQASVRCVLGNHDLHLIAVHAGVAKSQKDDTLSKILKSEEGAALIAWLRHQPLFRLEKDWGMVHAGLLPEWSIQQAKTLSEEVEKALQSPDYPHFLAQLYGNEPNRWSDTLTGMDRMRVIVNGMTRLRFIETHSGGMNLKFKGEIPDAPEGLVPWFTLPARRSAGFPVIFGHWSALGLMMTEDLISVDTGCVWQGHLTAVRLEDRQIFQVPASS